MQLGRGLEGSSKPGLSHWGQDLPPFPGSTWIFLAAGSWEISGENCLRCGEGRAGICCCFPGRMRLLSRAGCEKPGWSRDIRPFGAGIWVKNLTEREPQQSNKDGNTPGTGVRLLLVLCGCWNQCLPSLGGAPGDLGRWKIHSADIFLSQIPTPRAPQRSHRPGAEPKSPTPSKTLLKKSPNGSKSTENPFQPQTDGTLYERAFRAREKLANNSW